MPDKPISANLEEIIFKIFWGSMSPDPPEGLEKFLSPLHGSKLFLG